MANINESNEKKTNKELNVEQLNEVSGGFQPPAFCPNCGRKMTQFPGTNKYVCYRCHPNG